MEWAPAGFGWLKRGCAVSRGFGKRVWSRGCWTGEGPKVSGRKRSPYIDKQPLYLNTLFFMSTRRIEQEGPMP
jgi:hypothetical protein